MIGKAARRQGAQAGQEIGLGGRLRWGGLWRLDLRRIAGAKVEIGLHDLGVRQFGGRNLRLWPFRFGPVGSPQIKRRRVLKQNGRWLWHRFRFGSGT